MIIEETMRAVCGYIGAGLMCACVALWAMPFVMAGWHYWHHKVER